MAWDIPIIDAHQHLSKLDLGYPWLAYDAPNDRYHGDDRQLRRNYFVEDYRRDFGDLPIVASVHIENGAEKSLAEATWLGQIIEEFSPIPAVHVAGADLSATNAPELLERLAAMPHVRGVRHILNWHPDSRYTHTNRPNISREPGFRQSFSRLAKLGLSFDCQVFAEQLAEVEELAKEHPETEIVLDHAGMPYRRDLEYLDSWIAGLTNIARLENVSVKISALGTTDHYWSRGSIAPLVLGVIDIFEPHRVMFASNFPVDSLYSTFYELYGAFDEITSDFSRGERYQMFADTAAQFYRIPLFEIVGREPYE